MRYIFVSKHLEFQPECKRSGIAYILTGVNTERAQVDFLDFNSTFLFLHSASFSMVLTTGGRQRLNT